MLVILLSGCSAPAASAGFPNTAGIAARRTQPTTLEPIYTSTFTETPLPSATLTRTPTATSSATPTDTPTATPTSTSTARSTRTAGPTRTRQPATGTSEAGEAVTLTRTPTQTLTLTASQPPTTTGTFTSVPTSVPSGPVLGYTGHISGVGPHLKTIYQRGQQLGNNPRAFSKIGDCEAAFPVFLQGFDAGTYDLGSYQYLGVALAHFAGSYWRVGEAADGGMSSSAVLNPIWSDPNVCNSGESPLACEYRLQRPSVALIMVRTLDNQAISGGQYHWELTQIVQFSINQGVIPVMSTVPYWGPNNPDTTAINDIIRRVAAENSVPLWDFWLTSEQLPNRGVTQDYHIADPAYTRSTYFDAESLQMAVTRRNLEALEVLHALLTQVIQN